MEGGAFHLPFCLRGAAASGGCAPRKWRWPSLVPFQPLRSSRNQGNGLRGMDKSPAGTYGYCAVAPSEKRSFCTVILYQLGLRRSLIRRKSLCCFSEGDGTRTRNHRIDSSAVGLALS